MEMANERPPNLKGSAMPSLRPFDLLITTIISITKIPVHRGGIVQATKKPMRIESHGLADFA